MERSIVFVSKEKPGSCAWFTTTYGQIVPQTNNTEWQYIVSEREYYSMFSWLPRLTAIGRARIADVYYFR